MLLLPAFCLICFTVSAQDLTVTGTVSDAQGGIPGVSVTVKGTTTGGSTDATGKYSVRVGGPGAVLVFSSLGYKPVERTVGNTTTINVTMQEAQNNLDEVIVTAFGTERRADVTGAISTVEAKDIMKSPVTNVTNALTGRVSGVSTVQNGGRPGQNEANIFIRGQFNADAAALIIVDGVEREGFGDIDPNDIASISVLKDAASTALYGLKGANGVIVVTTKRGLPGKPTVSYRGSIGLNTFGQIPKPLDAFNSATLHQEAIDNVNRLGYGLPNAFSPADLEIYRNGTGDPLLYPDVQWTDELLRDVWPQTQHNLSFRGGSQKAQYFVSLGYTYEEGGIKELNTAQNFSTVPKSDRINIRSNLDYSLTKTTKLSLNLAAFVQKGYTPRIPNNITNAADGAVLGSEFFFRTLQTVPTWSVPFFPEYTDRSTPEMIALDDTFNHIRQVWYIPGGDQGFNPYAALKNGGFFQSEENVLESTFMVNQELGFITPGLSANALIGYDQRTNSAQALLGSVRQYRVDRATGNLNAAPVTGQAEIGDLLNNGGSTGGGRMNLNILTRLDYNRNFKDVHKVNATILGSREFQPLQGNNPPRAFQGITYKTGYSYKDKYYVQVNGSYSGSESFAPGYRYGFFPVASLAYTITEEPFMNNVKEKIGLDYLKLRGSYGLSGFAPRDLNSRFLYQDEYGSMGNLSNIYFGDPLNQGVGRFFPQQGNQRGQNNVWPNTAGKASYYAHTRAGNPAATFEKQLGLNLGMDMYWLNNAIQFTGEYFNDIRSNILLPKTESTPLTYGDLLPEFNYGETQRKGFELDLKLNKFAKKGQDISYGAGFMYSHVMPMVNIANDAPNEPNRYLLTAGSIYGQFRGYASTGELYQSQAEADAGPTQPGFPLQAGDPILIDQNGDNILDQRDYVTIGYSEVQLDNYSFSPWFRFKNFEISALFQAADKVSNPLYPNDNVVQYFDYQLDRWTPDNPGGKIPALRPGGEGTRNIFYGNGANFPYNEYTLQDGSYIKLRNVNIAYQVPKKFSEKFGMSNLTLALQGQNLYTWTNYLGYDPENYNNSNIGGTLGSIVYPNIRNFIFSFTANF